MLVTLTLNGARLSEDVRPDMTLFDFCRAHGYKSVKCACETSNCGLCTVLLDGEPVLSCSVLMARADGHDVTTLEGMGPERELLSQCLAEEGAEQCGFCAPGLEMAVLAMDAAHAGTDDETIRRYLSGNLCRCSGYASQMRAIRRFLARHKNGGELPPRDVPADPTTQGGEKHEQVARPVAKKDSGALLAGKPVYTADLAPEGALVVKLVRSRHANALVTDIDKSRALEVPGVVAVFGPDDVPHHRFTLAGQSFLEPSPYDTVILDRHVRYVGDEVAMVVAESEAAAAAGVRAVKVTYEQLPAVLDVEEALDNEVVVHDEDDWKHGSDTTGDAARNLVAHGETVHGDLDAAFAASDVVIERTYRTQATQQAMMETFRSFAYTDAFGRLTVVSSTQVPFHIRRQVATALGLPKHQVRVIKPRVGGGFGAKQSGCNEAYAALAALKTGRPCICSYTREETMSCSNTRHEMVMKVRVGARRDGTIEAIDLYALSNAGAYGYHGTTTVTLVGGKTLPIYNHAAASRFAYDVVYTNTTPGGAYRGYGATQGCFAVESAINELADELGMDPCELRLKNLVKPGETLWQLGQEHLNSCRLDECLERAMDMVGWKGRPLSEDLGARVRGIGVALTMQGSGISHLDIANVDIRLEDDGFYVLSIGATDVGTGADTILAQMAAEALGCDVDRIVTKGVDTDTSPFDTGAYASSGTYITGGAVLRAAEDLISKIRAQAAHVWGVEAGDVEFDGECVRCGENEMTVAALANQMIGFGLQPGMLEGHGSNTQPTSPPPYMAGIAEVEVDKATGKVEVTDYAAVVDCGTVINPALARVQAEGGISQGIGMALTEDVVRDERGGLRTSNFMTYKVPTRMDVPEMRVEFMPSFEPTGPFGAKSIGEVVINTPSPAVMSAVAHATGRYVRSLPITPSKVLLGE
ncbi:molybdopterin-dependent oxidoreductase [Thermophilibacter provencensis]|uniref:Molybdopterin-dependent oxidoreductase n=1 Tax=Thermophilibacter provencensis TaxID=1852386 RepID=A0ABT7V1M7_9ACTN|nr:molybdopterin cofactor-binding domain-containing protein [Thermophilibacter provencensis]MDM8270511.1 molybdopterin-dependent oxidoreductase [Thermophilibacter provencensis]